jgi:hypothetical protein
MGNFFNNGPKIWKLIVRVRIYHIFKKNVDLKSGFAWIFIKDGFLCFIKCHD